MKHVFGFVLSVLTATVHLALASSATMHKDSSSGKFDSLETLLSKRSLGISIYLGVDFIDFGGKENFQKALTTRIATDAPTHTDSLKALQNFESVHLAFPVGVQAVLPISAYLDVVAKTHSYWYKQTAILGNRITNAHAADEWYAVQANLIGTGIRYYLTPALLSVTGQLGLYTQGVWYWNLGHTELYSPYGNAPAVFNPFGSGYEIQLGFQQAILKPWKLTGSIGYLHQEFKSEKQWQNLLAYAAPSGKVAWNSSSVQANLNLWYHFGVVSQIPLKKPAPADSSRRL